MSSFSPKDGRRNRGRSSLLRDPRLYGMALMAPATILIVVMHSLTTGRVFLYFSGYFLPTGGALFTSICASVEYDLLYTGAFISFFLVMPLALAARIGELIAGNLSKGSDSRSSSVRFVSKVQGSMVFLLAFILIHAIILPLLLRFPLGRLLWVEHNIARNVAILSPILFVVGSLVQLIHCFIFRARIVTDSEDPSPISAPSLSPARRAFLLLIGAPLGGIAFWLMSAVCSVILCKACGVIFGGLSLADPTVIIGLVTVMFLSFMLATLVGLRLGIWRRPVRALLVISLVTLASQLFQPFAFPIDWFEVCTIWTD